MITTSPTHARDVTKSAEHMSAERMREALSVLPTAVDDEAREELSPYPPDSDDGERRT